MNASIPILLRAHDVVGACIDRAFPPSAGTDEIRRWDTFWRARRETAERTGIIYEHHTPGKKLLYENLTDSLEACVGGSLLGCRVAEFGSGSGYAGLCVAARGAHVVMIDAGEEAVRYSRFVAECLGLADRIAWVRADAQLPVAALGAFDLCFNSGVVEHYPPEVASTMLKHMAAAVRPGGIVWAAVPNLVSPLLLYRMMRSRSKGTERFYTPWLLRRVFRMAGLPRVNAGCLNAFVSVEASELVQRVVARVRPQRWACCLSSLFYCWAVAPERSSLCSRNLSSLS
jgi:2-polyprenyl-3-methyl-5-hydroxy-6-metoxy-1,4-benzoquinol methylase